MPRFQLSAVATLCVLGLTVAPGPAAAQQPNLPPELAAARAMLDKYADPIVAVHDGFLSTMGCIEYPKGADEGTMQYAAGGMGVHLLNAQNIGPTLDPAKPQVLIYEPQGNKLHLVAAEWFVPAAVVGESSPPSIFGKQLQGPMEGHQPIMPPELHHYDLHVWLWKDNPAGIFSPTNPKVSCKGAAYSYAEGAPKMVHTH